MRRMINLLVIIVLAIFCSTSRVDALDIGNTSIRVGSLELELEKDRYEYGVVASYRKDSVDIDVTADNGIEVVGDGRVELKEQITYRDIVLSKDGEAVTYRIKITKRDVPQHPIDLSKIFVYVNNSKVALNNGMILKYDFDDRNLNVNIGVKILQDDVELATDVGLKKLDIGENVFDLTFKTEDDTYTQTIKIYNGDKIAKEPWSLRQILKIVAVVILVLMLIYTYFIVSPFIFKLSLFLVSVILFINSFVLCLVVDGRSMENTLHDKQVLIAQNQFFKYERGDIVTAMIVKPLNNKKDFVIKRVIGLPGDTIEIKKDILYVNGIAQEEKYIKEPMDSPDLKITLSDDEYFLMGDNRNNSLDSRMFGAVKESQINSKVLFK